MDTIKTARSKMKKWSSNVRLFHGGFLGDDNMFRSISSACRQYVDFPGNGFFCNCNGTS